MTREVWFFDASGKNGLHQTMEAGRADGARHPELVEEQRHRARTIRRIWNDVIAAERTGRRARLVELDSRYGDLIVRRWQETSGGQAQRRNRSCLRGD